MGFGEVGGGRRCEMNAHPAGFEWGARAAGVGSLAWSGRQALGGSGVCGQCLTAGCARRWWFYALYGSTSPGEVLLEILQKRGAEGGEPG